MKFLKLITTSITLLVLMLTWGLTVSMASPIFTDTSGSAEGWTVAVNLLGYSPGEGLDITFDMFALPGTTPATPRTNQTNWIANHSDGSNGGIGNWTLFTFQQSFSLAGYDPTKAELSFQWAADDSGENTANRGKWTPKFSLNGGTLQAYPGSPTPTYSLSSPITLSSGFVAETNTITFYVEGNGQTDGLSVKGLSFTAAPAPVPIPAAIWLLGSGLLGLVGVRRKFNK